MAIKKVQIIPPGYSDILHPETDSDMVLIDGSTLTVKLAEKASSAELTNQVTTINTHFTNNDTRDMNSHRRRRLGGIK